MEDTYEPAPVHRRGPGRQLMALRQMGKERHSLRAGLTFTPWTQDRVNLPSNR